MTEMPAPTTTEAADLALQPVLKALGELIGRGTGDPDVCSTPNRGWDVRVSADGTAVSIRITPYGHAYLTVRLDNGTDMTEPYSAKRLTELVCRWVPELLPCPHGRSSWTGRPHCLGLSVGS